VAHELACQGIRKKSSLESKRLTQLGQKQYPRGRSRSLLASCQGRLHRPESCWCDQKIPDQGSEPGSPTRCRFPRLLLPRKILPRLPHLDFPSRKSRQGHIFQTRCWLSLLRDCRTWYPRYLPGRHHILPHPHHRHCRVRSLALHIRKHRTLLLGLPRHRIVGQSPKPSHQSHQIGSR